MNIEDLFEAETALRAAAREYHNNPNNHTSKKLRLAARGFSKLADEFDAAITASQASPT